MYPQTPGDQAKLRKVESPRLRRAWSLRSRRRMYTVLHLVLILAGAVMTTGWTEELPTGPRLLLSGAFGVVLIGWFFLQSRLNRATRMSLPHRLLDERQRSERDAAHRFSQQAMGVLLITVFAVVAMGTVYSPPSVVFPSWLGVPLLWTLALVQISLPACYLAWTQPDEPVDDTGEPAEN